MYTLANYRSDLSSTLLFECASTCQSHVKYLYDSFTDSSKFFNVCIMNFSRTTYYSFGILHNNHYELSFPTLICDFASRNDIFDSTKPGQQHAVERNRNRRRVYKSVNMYKSRRRLETYYIFSAHEKFVLFGRLYINYRCSGGWVVVVVGVVVVLCLHWCLVKLSSQYRSLHDITFAWAAARPRHPLAELSNLGAPLMACDKPRRDSDTRSASSMRDSVHIGCVYQSVSLLYRSQRSP